MHIFLWLQSGASTDDKTATIQYKPVMSLAGNNVLQALTKVMWL